MGVLREDDLFPIYAAENRAACVFFDKNTENPKKRLKNKRALVSMIQGSEAKLRFCLQKKQVWLSDPNQHEEVVIFLGKSTDSEWW
jgi:hypothetical protein